jgi:serine/threonine protein kinase
MMPRGDDVLLGANIGAYRVARLMGVGGMGRVYKAVHPSIGSRVAIKVLSREASDRRDLVERFFDEAKAVNMIRHESIVNVLDLAVLPDGRPYIVMEYLDGASLAAIVEEARRAGQQLPLGGIVRLVGEVLNGLEAAHANRVIHRDLKPDNIYVTPAGRAKILDFGIAKLQPELGDVSRVRTQSSSLLGTPHYMSPEQASGRPIDARADLYAVGVILFELLTLQRPFQATVLFDLLRMHIEAPPPAPRSVRADIPEGIEQIVLVSLAKLPEQRFASAQAMARALEHASASIPSQEWAAILPRPGGRGSQPAAWAPTPPASWAANATQPNTRNPDVVRTSNRPTDPPNPAPTPSTQTAGQVAAPTPARASKVPWIIAGAAVLAAAGVTVYMLGREPTATRAAEPGSAGSSSQQAVVDIDAALDEPSPAPAVVPIPVPTGELSDEEAEMMDDFVGSMIENLPPEQQAQFPPELRRALKKYGGWSKIPKDQRKKLLANVGGMVGGLMGDANAAGRQAADALAGETGDPGNTSLTMPGFNGKQVDVATAYRWATREATKLYADAKLFRLTARNVDAAGVAVFAAPTDYLDFRFITPSRKNGECAFMINITADGAAVLRAVGVRDCAKEALRAPTCSVKQVWLKAIAAGTPADQRAHLDYIAPGGKGRWLVTSGTKLVDVTDDCK